MDYSTYTYNSSNLLRRYSHNKRLDIGLELVKIRKGDSILDYGCGDGIFLKKLKAVHQDSSIFYAGLEPEMKVQEEHVQLFRHVEEIKKSRQLFNVVTCFEVLEHFNPTNQQRMIADIWSLLPENGKLVISVPIEIGLPSLIKNISRKMAYPNDPTYRFSNIVKSLLYLPPRKYREYDGYLSHMGFDYRALEVMLRRHFVLKRKLYSPFRNLGAGLNSQVFYSLKKRHDQNPGPGRL